MNTCPICGEDHASDITLSFDGFGVNSCGNYRARLATFTSATNDKQVALLGEIFANAPIAIELLADALPYIEEGEQFNKESCRTLSKRVRNVLRTVYPNGGY